MINSKHKEINKQIKAYDMYGYCKDGSMISKDKIGKQEYLNMVSEFTDFYAIANKPKYLKQCDILTAPNYEEFKLLRIISGCCAVEHDKKTLAKYISIPESIIKKNGYKYKTINTLQSQYLENLFFDNEFKKYYFTDRTLNSEFTTDNWEYDLNICRNNNITNDPLSKFDFDGKVENSIIYVDIKGRYNPNTYFLNGLRDENGRFANLDINRYISLDIKTIFKYYCRKHHEDCKIWIAFYHNYGPQSYGISYLDFDKLLSYLNITKNKGAVMPQLVDLKSNPLITYPLQISLKEDVIRETKGNYNYLNNIIYIDNTGSNSYSPSIYFDYAKMCCSTNEFINAISQ